MPNLAAWNSRSPFHSLVWRSATCRGGQARIARQHPVGGEGDVAVVEVLLDRRLDLRDQAVVLGMEDLLDGGQADVLVHPAVAGDIVRVEQFVVVGRLAPVCAIEWLSVAHWCRRQARAGRSMSTGVGVVRHVVDEGAADGDRV